MGQNVLGDRIRVTCKEGEAITLDVGVIEVSTRGGYMIIGDGYAGHRSPGMQKKWLQ